MISYLAAAFLVLLALELPSQKLLFHKNNFKEETYQIGDVISFKLGTDKSKRTRRILGFEDSCLFPIGLKLKDEENWLF